MSKRRRSSGEQTDVSPFPKRRRDSTAGPGPVPIDRLSSLSNELLLHILSFLPVSSLSVCQRLSHRFNDLSGDSELWKRQYYTQWVRPRARRLASARRSTISNKAEYSPKVSTWLDHGHLAANGRVTNWKGQYRLRHNWSRGLCRLSEVEFPPRQYPPVLAKLCAGFVFTADSEHGIRVWAAKDPAICLATVSFKSQTDSSKICPTALAVSGMQEGQDQDIVVGFEDGHYDRYIFHSEVSRLELQSSHTGSSQGAVTAMALSSPFLLIVSHDKRLSLHRLYPEPAHPESGKESSAPSDADNHSRELTSLKADNMIAPMTLCLRKSPFEIVATIVYSFFHIGCGWALGIQELHFNKEGEQLESRLTSTVDSQYGIEQSRLSQSRRRRSTTTATATTTARTESTSHHNHYNLPDDNPPTMPSILHKQPPTSMSYSHPYLLTSHADNTLTMYLVVSNSTNLFVRGGQRLWGHTSSVSTVQVTNRGKAISVGTRGDEIRIWELETAISSLGSTRCFNEDSSIQVSPEKGDREEKGKVYIGDVAEDDRKITGDAGGGGGGGGEDSRITIHECVGFDEERVLLLREKGIGTQLLECYDFT